MKKRLLSLLLTLSMALALLPAPALAATKNDIAKVVRTSGDPLSGYYIVYELNGTQYRSDEMGAVFNMHAWKELDEADRRKIMYCFAFAPGDRKEQFGEAGSTEMTSYINEVTGWTEAAEILETRIANREYPDLSLFYADREYSTAAPEALAGEAFISHADLPEVRTLNEKQESLYALYDVGAAAFAALSEAKTQQVSTAVKSLSADLISLICERALVPAISPAGLAGLSASAAEEIISLLDKATGASNELYSCVLGDMPDSGTARRIIDKLWEIIELNEQIARKCMREVVTIRAEVASGVFDAQQAIEDYDSYIAGRKTAVDTANEAVTKREITPSSYAPASGEASAKITEAIAHGNQINRQLTALINGLTDRVWETLELLPETPLWYEGWQGYNMDQNGFPDMESIADYCIQTDTETDPETGLQTPVYEVYYDKLERELPADITAAVLEAGNEIADYNSYKAAAESLIASACSEYFGYASELAAVNKVLGALGSSHRFSFDTAETALASALALREPGGKTVDELVRESEDYRQKLMDYEARWKTESADFEDMMEDAAGVYAETQVNLKNAWDAYDSARSSRYALLDALPKYVTDQYVFSDGKLDAILFPFYDSSHEYRNPTIYARYEELLGSDDRWGDTYAQWDSWAAELTEWTTALSGYERKMAVAQKHIAYYAKELDAMSNGGSADAVRVLGRFALQTAGKLQTASGVASLYKWKDLPNAGPKTEERDRREQALRGLQRDFSYQTEEWSEYAVVMDGLREDKAAFMRAEGNAYVLQNKYWNKQTEFNRASDTYTAGRLVSDMWNELDAVFAEWMLEKNAFVPVESLYKGGENTLHLSGIEEADACVAVGETVRLSASLFPSNATDQTLIWDCTDVDVATVDGNGVVTGVSDGLAAVTVRARDSVRTTALDGTVSYDPAPLSFVIAVGSGVEPAADWFTPEGMAAPLFRWLDCGNDTYYRSDYSGGKLTAACALDPNSAAQLNAVLALYLDGRMLDISMISPSTGSGLQLLSVSADMSPEERNRAEIRLFVLDGSGAFAPLCKAPISGSVQ